jgi:hypothetical protein
MIKLKRNQSANSRGSFRQYRVSVAGGFGATLKKVRAVRKSNRKKTFFSGFVREFRTGALTRLT